MMFIKTARQTIYPAAHRRCQLAAKPERLPQQALRWPTSKQETSTLGRSSPEPDPGPRPYAVVNLYVRAQIAEPAACPCLKRFALIHQTRWRVNQRGHKGCICLPAPFQTRFRLATLEHSAPILRFAGGAPPAHVCWRPIQANRLYLPEPPKSYVRQTDSH